MKKTLYIMFAVAIVFAINCGSAQAQFGTVVSLTGSIMNEVSLKPVSIRYEVFDENGKKIYIGQSNSKDGYYFITGLQPGKTYTMKINDPKYFKENYTIEIPQTKKYAEFSKDYLVKPLERDFAIPIKVPPFELNKSKLRVGADYFLEKYVQSFKDNPRVKFTIECYPDNMEDKDVNAKLTDERCGALKDYFIKNGIDAERIKTEGHVATDPDNPPPTRSRAKGKRYIGPGYLVIKYF